MIYIYFFVICVTFSLLDCFIYTNAFRILKSGGDDLDKKLLELMYEKYYRELYIYIYSMCRSSAITEDILQETFLKAFISLKDSHTNMRAWLYMAARNICLNTIKKNSRIVDRSDINNNSDVSITASDAAEPSADTTLEAVLRNEEQRILYRAVLRLPPEKRDIIILQYFTGLRQKEIAALMRMTPENVRVTAHRAKKDLKKILEAEIPPAS